MDETRPGYYAIIPADVRYDDSIPPNAKLLYGEISALIGAEGYCFASNQYFSKLYGMADETIARLITKLEKAGHIRREFERDKAGQIVSRKLYLRVSVPEIQPLDEKINTPRRKNQEGIDKKVKDTNTSITNIEKENKKEKAMPLSGEKLGAVFVEWITANAQDSWSSGDKNLLYRCLAAFYKPRENKKQQPSRSKTAVKTLLNRLARLSNGDLFIMCEMLERSTIAGWKSVFPLSGDAQAWAETRARRNEEWL